MSAASNHALHKLEFQHLCVFTGNTSIGPTLHHMWEQEKGHRKKFEELLPKYRVRPTILVPLWNVAGFVLGAGVLSSYIIF